MVPVFKAILDTYDALPPWLNKGCTSFCAAGLPRQRFSLVVRYWLSWEHCCSPAPSQEECKWQSKLRSKVTKMTSWWHAVEPLCDTSLSHFISWCPSVLVAGASEVWDVGAARGQSGWSERRLGHSGPTRCWFQPSDFGPRGQKKLLVGSLFLAVWPRAPSSVLASSSDAGSP